MYIQIAKKPGVAVTLPSGKKLRLPPAAFYLRSATNGDDLSPFGQRTREDLLQSVYVDLGPEAAELERLCKAAAEGTAYDSTRVEELVASLTEAWKLYRKSPNAPRFAPQRGSDRTRVVRPRPGILQDSDMAPSGAYSLADSKQDAPAKALSGGQAYRSRARAMRVY
jgi:hypothetical protein